MNSHDLRVSLDDESSGLRDRIGRDIGSSSVALIRVFGPPQPDRVELGGTGTLVSIGRVKYVLTAAHVWHKFLEEKAVGVGLTLKEKDEHRFALNIETIIESPVANVGKWGKEWGPDLTLLRIPPEHLGRIEAHKVFRNLTVPSAQPQIGDALEMIVLMGAPGVDVVFDGPQPDIRMNSFFCKIVERHTRENFDYIDLEMDLSLPQVSEDFRGVSGGGLWRVIAFGLPNGKIDWSLSLVGVAFYQFEPDDNKTIIRCHGPESIRIAMETVAPAP